MTIKTSLINASKKTAKATSVATAAVVHYGIDEPASLVVTAAHNTKNFFGTKGAEARAAKLAVLRRERKLHKETQAQIKADKIRIEAEVSAKLSQSRQERAQTA